MANATSGQLAASASAILTVTSDGTCDATFNNTSASLTETVLVTLLRGSSTLRITRAVLAPNEALFVQGLFLAAGDVLQGQASDAATVDYTTNPVGTGPALSVYSLDASGNRKNVSSAVSGNQVVSGSQTAAGFINTGVATASVGGSTAAAGTTVSDAGALPAGTAEVYPTTGANGTTGVVINAADQVTGRRLFIGNGVSNAILKVYGPSGATINGASSNVAFSSASGKGVIAVCLSGSGNTWLMW